MDPSPIESLSPLPEGAETYRVALFHRRPFPDLNHSVETVFDTIRDAFSDRVLASKIIVPWLSRGVWRRIGNMIAVRLRASEVNHVTGDIHYVTLLLPKRTTILTILDCRITPRSAFARWLMTLLWFRLPVRRVAAITVISEATRQDLLRLTNCDPKIVHVIPCAVAPWFKHSVEEFNTTCPTLLQVGTAQNKNILRLCEALSAIRCRLVIIGKLTREQRAALASHDIEFTNLINLSRADLAAEYERCDIVTYVSTFEGFGLPILEAQVVGRPVVTSDLAPMNDIVGMGACLVDPFDVASIHSGIKRLITDASFRNEIVRAGRQNVARFAPTMIAQQYEELYEAVLSDKARSIRQGRGTTSSHRSE
jgi:glycosyltransferase involved in cell wall biosynthesis